MLKFIVLLAVLTTVLGGPEPWTKLTRAHEVDNSLRFEPYTDEALLRSKWTAFKTTYNKRYEPEEEEMRRTIYETNLKKIELHNYLYDKGLRTFTLGENEYSDMEHREFVAIMNGYVPSNRTLALDRNTYMSPLVDLKLPDTVDWRTKGYVTPVKNQGQCGSCWAFSSTGSLEGQHFRKTGQLVSLSEQQLVDCSKDWGNNGCNGGWMDNAFQYIKDNGGIDTEECYPYTAREGTCKFQSSCVGATDVGFTDLPEGDESSLQEAVASVGPISVAIDAEPDTFMQYKTGVFYDSTCSTTRLDHAVLVVGYGTENGQDYWLVKNSWGASWGEQGYIKMSRNQNNQCGIATKASYPRV